MEFHTAMRINYNHVLKYGGVSKENRINDYTFYVSVYIKFETRQIICDVTNQASDYSGWDVVTERDQEGTPGLCDVVSESE